MKTCPDCCNFIRCGIRPCVDVLKCSAFLDIDEAKAYFNIGVKNQTKSKITKEKTK